MKLIESIKKQFFVSQEATLTRMQRRQMMALPKIMRSSTGQFFIEANVEAHCQVEFGLTVEEYFKEKYTQHIVQEPGQKKPLPNHRGGATQKFHIGEITIYLRTGEYPDGTLGEIFIDLDKTGSTLRATMNCFAIMVSMALQHGVPLEKITDKFLFTKFEPAGMVQHNEDIKQCSSIIDLIFKDLAINYLGREDLKNV